MESRFWAAILQEAHLFLFVAIPEFEFSNFHFYESHKFGYDALVLLRYHSSKGKIVDRNGLDEQSTSNKICTQETGVGKYVL